MKMGSRWYHWKYLNNKEWKALKGKVYHKINPWAGIERADSPFLYLNDSASGLELYEDSEKVKAIAGKLRKKEWVWSTTHSGSEYF